MVIEDLGSTMTNENREKSSLGTAAEGLIEKASPSSRPRSVIDVVFLCSE